MNVSSLIPRPESCEPFRRDALNSIPAVAGCYVLTTAMGIILYVGLAVNLRNRMQQHLSSKAKTMPTSAGKAVLFWWVASDRNNALERGWLNQHKIQTGLLPILNCLDSPVSC